MKRETETVRTERMKAFRRIQRAVLNDLQPRLVWRCMRQRLKEVIGAFIMLVAALFLIPISITLLVSEPLMIVIRPVFYAVFQPKAVEKFIASLDNQPMTSIIDDES